MNESNFDIYIHDLLSEAGIKADYQHTSIIQLQEALATASKSQNGNNGMPDFIAVVKDYVLVIEDKADRGQLALRDAEGLIAQTVDATKNYAVNGAVWYARKILEHGAYTKIFAFGNAGDNKHHILKPFFVGLDGVTWRGFRIGDLFTLMQGKAKGANHLKNDPSGISYLGATNRNNAVLDFVKPEDGLIQKGNCIAFIRNGEGSIGYSVYKAEDFIATSDITAGYAPFLDKYIGMFITTVADKVRGKYSFNYKRSDTRLKKEVIQLPVTDSGLPDWHLMHNFMLSLESQRLSAVISHFTAKLHTGV